MTVLELIERLKLLDPEKQVYYKGQFEIDTIDDEDFVLLK